MKNTKPSVKIGTRAAGRMIAIQGLYQMDIAHKTASEAQSDLQNLIQQGNIENIEFGHCDFQLTETILKGAVKHQQKIDVLIIKHLPEKWTISRIDKVICAILRAALFELLFNTEIPAKIVIHEYTNMASAFGVNDNNHLIYGLLNKIATQEQLLTETA